MNPTRPETDILTAMLHAVGANGASTRLTAFLPITGACYTGELMVVGRAVNGWGGEDFGFEAADCKTQEALATIVHRVAEESSSKHGECPMQWIADGWQKGEQGSYRSSRSAYWRGVKNVFEGLGLSTPSDPAWPSHLAWSNLYKVSPLKSGNPSEKLCRIIEADCIKLLYAEIAARKPKRILFLTGMNWARPFLADHAVKTIPQNRYAEATATIAGAHAVIAKHPQGKPGDKWANEVLEAFKRGVVQF